MIEMTPLDGDYEFLSAEMVEDIILIRFKKDLGKVKRLVKAVRRAENELALIHKVKNEKSIINHME